MTSAVTPAPGGLVVRQSDLATWQKCPLQYRYSHIDKLPRLQSGSLTFGSIIHDCVFYLETTGDLPGAIARFHQYWNEPTLLGAEYKIQYFVRGTNWKKFHDLGPQLLHDWWGLIQWDTDVVLGREYEFDVPIGDGHVLHGTIDKLTLRYQPKKNRRVLLVSDYKDLALDTRLPTPTGWTTMGEVRVGDQLIGGDGHACTVVAKSSVYTDNDCYRVTFDDGSSIIAGAEHQWSVETDDGPMVLTTCGMRDRNARRKERDRQKDIRIPNVPVRLDTADLPIEPYVFGAWIGDGASMAGVISKPLDGLFEEIERLGYRVGPDVSAPDRCQTRTVYGIRPHLRALGVLGNKHIPDCYLRASRTQRLRLLQGIMDTDGHWNAARKRCALTTTDQHYAEQVYELVCSLGWKAATFKVDTTGFGQDVVAWQTWFTPVDAEVFRVRRPKGYRKIAPAKSRRRLVVKVEPTLTVPTQCLQVDSNDHTFLCGEQMVRTHNTNSKTPTYDYLNENLQFTAYSYATTRPQFWTGIENGERLFAELVDTPRWGEWVSLVALKRMDAGERTQQQYNRLIYAVNALAASVAMRIFVPNISGESCRYCDFRKQCGLPELDDNGAPVVAA